MIAHRRGYSLLELCVTLSIICVAAGAFAYASSRFGRGDDARRAAMALAHVMESARAHAVATDQSVEVFARTDATTPTGSLVVLGWHPTTAPSQGGSSSTGAAANSPGGTTSQSAMPVTSVEAGQPNTGSSSQPPASSAPVPAQLRFSTSLSEQGITGVTLQGQPRGTFSRIGLFDEKGNWKATEPAFDSPMLHAGPAVRWAVRISGPFRGDSVVERVSASNSAALAGVPPGR